MMSSKESIESGQQNKGSWTTTKLYTFMNKIKIVKIKTIKIKIMNKNCQKRRSFSKIISIGPTQIMGIR